MKKDRKVRFLNEFWAVIPARSGSKSIKNKNIKKLNGEPLIFHSIKFALKIKKIKTVILSSDSTKYLKISKKFKNLIRHKRKKNASNDKSSDIMVLEDFINFYLKKKYLLPKYFIYFRPTSPVREKRTIEKAINLFKKKGKNYSSLSSINEMSETAFKSVKIQNYKLIGAFNNLNLDALNIPRQNFPQTYRFNGIIDIFKTKNIFEKKLYGNKVLAFHTKNDFNIEIDTKADFKKVEEFLKKY